MRLFAGKFMNEYPILFSAEMVRAILDGRKTQTRRIIKAKHEEGVICGAAAAPGHAIESWGGGQWSRAVHSECLASPYGAIGDKLWVKETWAAWDKFDGDASEISGRAKDLVERGITQGHISYRADPQTHADKWRPSIFMPRWASRITLEIVSVRVERLQDISHRDALAEGVEYDVSKQDGNPIARYQKLWESINGKGSWAQNPWVWCVEFKKL